MSVGGGGIEPPRLAAHGPKPVFGPSRSLRARIPRRRDPFASYLGYARFHCVPPTVHPTFQRLFRGAAFAARKIVSKTRRRGIKPNFEGGGQPARGWFQRFPSIIDKIGASPRSSMDRSSVTNTGRRKKRRK